MFLSEINFMLKITLYILLTCVVVKGSLFSQTLNAYAKISDISGTSLTVTNVNQTSHTFSVGGLVIVMQMQDNCIGTNTTNASTFGDISSIANAGIYELGIISSRSPSTGTPTTIVLSSTLGNTYNTGSNSSVQLITFRDLGANYTTTANISGLSWDGNVGGVIAISVTNTLTLNHSISADGIGFRGGAVSSNYYDGTTNCNTSSWRSSSANDGYKGEGIYKITDVNFTNSMAKILNGGGGGGQINAGGGGGGNYSAGGDGGSGWSCALSDVSEGKGGISLLSYISGTRIFMGGGGGGGQQNNSAATAGGNGGGIIFIKASRIATSGSCGSAIRITANGSTASTAGNDGAGGGGAGGTIILNVATYSATSTCPLSVSANAGNGGQNGDGGKHAGGGGGGQGAVAYSTAQPTINVTTSTNNGTAGKDCTSCSVTGGSGSGSTNIGILPSTSTPLPIELVSFTGYCSERNFNLEWQTATETNNDYFIIEKSIDGTNWKKLNQLQGEGNSGTLKKYQYTDLETANTLTYYRLKQVDFDSKTTLFPTIVYNDGCLDDDYGVDFYPNPANSTINLKKADLFVSYNIINALGQIIQQGVISSNPIFISGIFNGVYLFQLVDKKNALHSKKIIIEHTQN